MTTERLYYDDSYLREFDARVLCVREGGWAALDRSAFYPTSGGQPFDTGVLFCEGRAHPVTDVQAEDGLVWHKTDGPLPPGAPVHGEIHWPRRLDHMQQHAADHMLAGAAWQLYGGVTIGLHIGAEASSIDMDLPGGRTHLTQDEITALETLVNQRVQQDDPIRCWFPSPGELPGLPLRKPPAVQDHVRVVAMGDYEMVPCGGTHPASTGQIGPVKILSCEPARGKMRLSFAAGMRAVAHFQRACRCAGAVSALLSSGWEEAAEALARERDQASAFRRESRRQLSAAAIEMISQRRQGNLYAAHLDFSDPETLLKAASHFSRDPDALILLSCPRKGERALVFARGEKAAPDMARLLRDCGARGGGKPDLAQGSAPGQEALDRAVQILKAAIKNEGCAP